MTLPCFKVGVGGSGGGGYGGQGGAHLILLPSSHMRWMMGPFISVNW